jgi:hypothetical protein
VGALSDTGLWPKYGGRGLIGGVAERKSDIMEIEHSIILFSLHSITIDRVSYVFPIFYSSLVCLTAKIWGKTGSVIPGTLMKNDLGPPISSTSGNTAHCGKSAYYGPILLHYANHSHQNSLDTFCLAR